MLDIYHKSQAVEIKSELIEALSHKAKCSFIKKYIMAKQDALGIIYCNTKSEVRQVCAYLSSESINIDCAAYYGVSDTADPEDIENSETIRQQNAETMNRFYDDEGLSCVVATTAFGMGIDKSRGRDVTYIINYGIPRSIESFYQEIGRAGRHSEFVCDCILLYDSNDARQLKSWLDYNPEYTIISSEYKLAVDRIEKMEEYAQLTSCEERNSFIEKYFESYTPAVDMTKLTKSIYLNRSKIGWYLLKPKNLSASNKKMPDMFDIMVLDAVNTHIINDMDGLTYLDILRTLSGKDYFDSKSPLNKAVEEGLEKMRKMTFHYDTGDTDQEIRLISFEIKTRKRGKIIDNINETVPSAYFDERAIYYKMPSAYLGLPTDEQRKKYRDKDSDLLPMPQTKEGLMIKYYLLSKITYARYLWMSYVKDEVYRRKLNEGIQKQTAVVKALEQELNSMPEGFVANSERISVDKLTKDTVETFLKKVIVMPGQQLEIQWKYGRI